jgi:hypothetical protein
MNVNYVDMTSLSQANNIIYNKSKIEPPNKLTRQAQQ